MDEFAWENWMGNKKWKLWYFVRYVIDIVGMHNIWFYKSVLDGMHEKRFEGLIEKESM